LASRKTEATELSLAFGILDRDPKAVEPAEIPLLFEGTLSPEKFAVYLDEHYGPNIRLYDTLFKLGARIRHSYPHFRAAPSLRWLGPDKLSRSVSSAQDLLVCGIPVSIKNDSNVVYNLSPHNLFERVPSGLRALPRSDNWFLRNAPGDMQSLYQIAVSDLAGRGFPAEYTEFERKATRAYRKQLQCLIRDRIDPEVPAFRHTYRLMCHSVSKSSTDLFNGIFARTVSSAERIPMLDGLLEVFFRLDSVPYLLAGIDGGAPFAVNVPSITHWRKEWQITSVQAVPDSASGQCIVGFEFTVEHRQTRNSHTLPFHAEVRWSHGKFCGNPEAKLYKNFIWTGAPFLTGVT
jgi:hypothetical protein